MNVIFSVAPSVAISRSPSGWRTLFAEIAEQWRSQQNIPCRSGQVRHVHAGRNWNSLRDQQCEDLVAGFVVGKCVHKSRKRLRLIERVGRWDRRLRPGETRLL